MCLETNNILLAIYAVVVKSFEKEPKKSKNSEIKKVKYKTFALSLLTKTGLDRKIFVNIVPENSKV